MIYLDTSLIVSAFVREPDSDRVVNWLEAHSPETFAISDWVVTEFAAALAAKVRRKAIKILECLEADRSFKQYVDASFVTIPFLPSYFQHAAELAISDYAPLRAGDALHLAIAQAGGAAVATRDREMATAAEAHGVETHLL